MEHCSNKQTIHSFIHTFINEFDKHECAEFKEVVFLQKQVDIFHILLLFFNLTQTQTVCNIEPLTGNKSYLKIPRQRLQISQQSDVNPPMSLPVGPPQLCGCVLNRGNSTDRPSLRPHFDNNPHKDKPEHRVERNKKKQEQKKEIYSTFNSTF